jgi:elongation factor Ts
MALRHKTGVSMMECKKALTQAGGNETTAIEILRKKGADKAAGKSDRTAEEGAVALSGNAIVSVKCETDFVARNDDFIEFVQSLADEAAEHGEDAAREKFEEEKAEKITQLGENLVFGEAKVLEGEVIGGYIHSNRKVGALASLSGGNESIATDIAMHVTAMNPAVTSPDEVSDDLVVKEKEIWKEQLREEGKPAEIIEKIMMGKEKKFREESALIKQPFVKEQGMTVEEYADKNRASVTGFARAMV